MAVAGASARFAFVLGVSILAARYVYESGKRVHVRKYGQKLAKEALT